MVDIRPTDAALGADITGVDLSRPLTSTEFGAIHGAWMDNLVLRFRGQQLSDEQLMTFSRNFGALDGNPAHAKVEGRAANATSGYVNIISNVMENGRPIGGLGNYGFHIEIRNGHHVFRIHGCTGRDVAGWMTIGRLHPEPVELVIENFNMLKPLHPRIAGPTRGDNS